MKSLLLTTLFGVVASAGSVVASPHQTSADNIDAGYSALKIFLEDEQYLTAIRRVKTVITFEGVSGPTGKLIDSIADFSEQALQELEALASAKPAIVFEDFDENSIGKATLDSMRYATAKEFLLDGDDFEKNLLLSQSQILRVISHLAKQLEQKESNPKRKAWLNKLAKHYEEYYRQVYARISVNA
ncbi:MAG: hypothetical protein JSW45_10345 [Thiotrichales bacterium]|nr:MAG: hypothetical protein JSW45_10345 [Thiotrichales bacterium]